jgi:hypothetical protein
MRHALPSVNLPVGLVATLAAALLLTACSSEPPTPGATPDMRRLTAEQYRHVIHDVFGSHIEVAGRFDPLVRTEGLLALGARNAPITPAGFEEFYNVARSVSAQVVSEENRNVLIPCVPSAADGADTDCSRRFVTQVGRLLYRRSLEPAEIETAVSAADEVASELGDFYAGIEYSLTGLLVTPGFLFIIDATEANPDAESGVALTAYAKASRLSFFLWDSAPDDMLLAAAESGALATDKGLSEQIDRMLESPLLARGIRAIFSDFLDLEKYDTLEKDTLIYPAYSIVAAEASREQLLRTVVDHIVARDAPYPELYNTPHTFIDANLGRIYQVPVTRPDGGWEPYQFPADDRRAGILTQMGFLALYSHPGRSSPTLRGKAVRELVLCHDVPDPPGDVDFSLFNDPDAPSRTARERLTVHSTADSCAGCHKPTDPLGLGFEQFDGIGQFRTVENDAVIDPAGDLDGVDYPDGRALAETIAQHPDVPACFTNQLYAYGIGRPTTRDDRELVRYLGEEFAKDGYSVTELMSVIANSKAFYKISMAGSDAPPVLTASVNDSTDKERGS